MKGINNKNCQFYEASLIWKCAEFVYEKFWKLLKYLNQ